MPILQAMRQGPDILGITNTKLPSGVDPKAIFQIVEILSPYYADIGSDSIRAEVPSSSPILNWDALGRNLGYDHLYTKDRIAGLYTNSLLSYTEQEQKILLQEKIPAEIDLHQLYTAQEIYTAGTLDLEKRREARTHRFDIVAMLLASMCGEAVRDAALAQVLPSNAILNYIHAGVTTIIDYIDGVNSFTGNGFLDQGFSILPSALALDDVPSDFSIDDVAAESKSILLNGCKVNGAAIF